MTWLPFCDPIRDSCVESGAGKNRVIYDTLFENCLSDMRKPKDISSQ